MLALLGRAAVRLREMVATAKPVSILETREVTAEERAAIGDEPRRGVWLEEHTILTSDQNEGRGAVVDRRGDGRLLDQPQTDSAIAAALFRNASVDEQGDVLGAVLVSLSGGTEIEGKQYATDQRGGIHSDPLVRLLAYRAWGERDRQWRKRDTAHVLGKAALGTDVRLVDVWRKAYGFDGMAFDQGWCTVRRNGVQATFSRAGWNPYQPAMNDAEVVQLRESWFDIFDELEAKLAAGGDPPPPPSRSFLDFSIT